MSTSLLFTRLKNQCKEADAELQKVSEDLQRVRLAKDYYDDTNRKIRDYSLFLSKLRLLRGKEHADTDQVQQSSNTNTQSNYQETAKNKIISDMLTKYVCTNKVVSELVMKNDEQLDDHEREIKELVISKHAEFRDLDSQLQAYDSMLTEHEDLLYSTRDKWHQCLGELRDMKCVEKDKNEEGPLHEKLTKVLDKLEMMRWLITCLMLCPSTDYDWIADPDKMADIRPMTRFINNKENIAMAGLD